MNPEALLEEAQELLRKNAEHTSSYDFAMRARAIVLLLRQAIEMKMAIDLAKHINVDDAKYRAKLLLLQGVTNAKSAQQTSYLWSALSHASHHQGYEMTPTLGELDRWTSATKELIEGQTR